MSLNTMNQAVVNIDKEIWREVPDDFYAPSIFVTEGGGIGIDVGGYVFVKPIKEWFRLAKNESTADQNPHP